MSSSPAPFSDIGKKARALDLSDFVSNQVSDQFPIGLKVLAIDANIVCLKYLVHLLQMCQYKVTATMEADEAIRLLKTENEGFDIIITNVIRSDMDGFKILGLQMDIPVIMVSANEDLEMVKRGVMEGAEAYLLKPVRLQELRIIWQYVLRKRSRHIIRPNPRFAEYNNANNLITEERDEDNKNTNLDNDDNINVVSSPFSQKKNRVNWTKELHDKFVEAYDQLREKERVPNNILKLMNVPSLSRDNVASHLQKHRDTLRKKKGSGVGKLVSHKNYYYDRNSTIYNSMNQRRNKVSNLMRSQVLAKSSMEQLQGNYENLQSTSTWTTTVAGCYSLTVPEFKWFSFPSNNSIISTLPSCDESLVGGFGLQYPLLESRCLDSATTQSLYQNNVGAISNDQEATLVPIGWSFPNNNTIITPGQCYQMQFDKGSSLMDDDLSAVLKQHFSSF